jgi:hypothetical protein
LISGTGILADSLLANSGVSGLGAGLNTFEWTVQNGTCPGSADTVAIVVNPGQTANAGPTAFACSDTIRLGAVPAQAPAVGTWSLVSGGGTIANPGQANTLVSGLPEGQSIFRWTLTSPGCPDNSDTVSVIRVPDNFSIGNDTLLCEGDSIVINLGNAFPFVVWQDGSTVPTYVIDTVGTYHVTVTTFQNCTFSDTLVVGICTGVKSKSGVHAVVRVQPNPFSGQFRLEVEGTGFREISYRLLTVNGVEVHQGSATSDTGIFGKDIRPRALPPGVYILETKLGNSVHRTKLVQQ